MRQLHTMETELRSGRRGSAKYWAATDAVTTARGEFRKQMCRDLNPDPHKTCV